MTERRDNYRTQMQQAQRRFLTYDQQRLIRKFSLPHDEQYLYVNLLCKQYRLERSSGSLQRQAGEDWVDANTFGEVMTLLDLLCDSRDDRYLTHRFQSMETFGLQFHRNLLEEQKDTNALRFDRDPAFLRRRCEAIGGREERGGDISYSFEVFDGLRLCLQFWHGDEEFAPRLRWLWDENALQYLRYETMYYAIPLLLRHILDE